MKKLIEVYNCIMEHLGIVFLLGFIVSVSIQVISRSFLPSCPAWTEEVARYSFIYMVACGSCVAVNKNEFVGVDLLTGMLPQKGQVILKQLVNLGLMIFCTYMLLNSVLEFALIQYRMVTTALEIPMQYIYFSMIMLFSTLIISFFLELGLFATKMRKKDEDKVEV